MYMSRIPWLSSYFPLHAHSKGPVTPHLLTMPLSAPPHHYTHKDQELKIPLEVSCGISVSSFWENFLLCKTNVAEVTVDMYFATWKLTKPIIIPVSLSAFLTGVIILLSMLLSPSMSTCLISTCFYTMLKPRKNNKARNEHLGIGRQQNFALYNWRYSPNI